MISPRLYPSIKARFLIPMILASSLILFVSALLYPFVAEGESAPKGDLAGGVIGRPYPREIGH